MTSGRLADHLAQELVVTALLKVFPPSSENTTLVTETISEAVPVRV